MRRRFPRCRGRLRVPENDRLRNAIGLAMKAGRISSGDFAVEKLTRAGKALLVLIDEEASENTRDKYAHLCRNAHIDLTSVRALGACIGRPGRMLAAVTDKNFTDMIRQAVEDGEADHSNDRG